MAKMRLTQAINAAYFEEMERNERIVLFGEDVEVSMFGDTRGLHAKFGSSRIRNTPISESAMTGMAVGAAMAGTPAICHLMFSNFALTGFDGIANQAAKLRLMTGGQAQLPVTFVAAIGAGTSTGAQHSDTPYPMFMNLGGINIAVPATPADAKGLMKSALRGFNPTIFLLPRVRGATSGEVCEDPDFLVPYGKASVMQDGSDITIVAIGSCVHHAIRAAKALAEDGISVELIDPRTLVPLDTDTIVASVRKTGRLVVVDEARDRCSAASHIAAVVGDEAFTSLKAPIKRVTSPNIPMPYAPALERALLPDPDKIVAAARLILAS